MANSKETPHQITNKRQFNWYNVFMVITMSWGAFAYGYSTAIIGPTLGMPYLELIVVTQLISYMTAQPSFIEYYDLETRKHATALISTMTVLSLRYRSQTFTDMSRGFTLLEVS